MRGTDISGSYLSDSRTDGMFPRCALSDLRIAGLRAARRPVQRTHILIIVARFGLPAEGLERRQQFL